MRAIAFGVVAAALSITFAQAQGWQTYSDARSGFSIQFPQKPERTDTSEQMSTGPLQESRIAARYERGTFVVAVDDHSRQKIPADPQLIVQHGVDAVATSGNKIRSRKKINVPHGAGREILVSDGTSLYRIRLYYVAPYAYTLMANYAGQNEDGWKALMAGDSKKFFSSFRLLRK